MAKALSSPLASLPNAHRSGSTILHWNITASVGEFLLRELFNLYLAVYLALIVLPGSGAQFGRAH